MGEVGSRNMEYKGFYAWLTGLSVTVDFTLPKADPNLKLYNPFPASIEAPSSCF